MNNIIKLLKDDHTIYFVRSYNRNDYIRIYLPTTHGLIEITHEISKLLEFKKSKMWMVLPKGKDVSNLVDKLNLKCDKLINYEDFG